MEDRFLSRTRTLQFNTPSMEAADGNMRAALMDLELELIVARSHKPKLVAVADQWGRTAYVPVYA